MPAEIFGERYPFLPKPEILTFEEIDRLTRIFVGLGVRKLRVTGGEPLLRADLPLLVQKLAAIPGVEDLALTTNGYLLAKHADALAQAGLRRVTVSLDSLDEPTFRRMNGLDLGIDRVLAGIEAASRVGLTPIKVNCVVVRGVNEAAVVDLARRFRGTGHILRLIEFMDVGTRNEWRRDRVVSAAEMLETIEREFPLEPLAPTRPGEVARRYRYRDGQGEIGVIASVTQPFCGGCTRARLSAEGQLFTCLFGSEGVDFKQPLRSGSDDAALRERVLEVWGARRDRYSEARSAIGPDGGEPDAGQSAPSDERSVPSSKKVEMYHIGG